MPHIHTEPEQHDMTTSAYIIRVDAAEPLLLVHMHLKYGKLFQVGGHIELAETPWQAITHELIEESGYKLEDLQILQPKKVPMNVIGAVVHPVPVLMNTHKVLDDHYHSDLCFAFVTDKTPAQKPVEGESADLRWLTLEQLHEAVEQEIAAEDVYEFYKTILSQFLDTYERVPAVDYSLEKPREIGV